MEEEILKTDRYSRVLTFMDKGVALDATSLRASRGEF